MTLTAAPILDTEHLRLRGPQTRDTEAVIAFLMDKDRAELFGHYDNRGDAWRWFAMNVGHWHIHGYGYFIIADKDTDQAMGLCGVWNPEGWPEPEIGWSVFDAAEGKGYAFEAAVASRAYAYDILGWSTIISLTIDGNSRSDALAKRMGCTRDGIFDHPEFGPMNIWRHQPADALQDGGMEAYS